MPNLTNYIVRGPKEELDKLAAKIQSKTNLKEDRSTLMDYRQDAIHYVIDISTKQIYGWCWCSLNVCPLEQMYLLPSATAWLDLSLKGANKEYKTLVPKPNPRSKKVVIKDNPSNGEMSFNGFDWLLTKSERDQDRYIAAERAIMDYLTMPWYKRLFRGHTFLYDFIETRLGL